MKLKTLKASVKNCLIITSRYYSFYSDYFCYPYSYPDNNNIWMFYHL